MDLEYTIRTAPQKVAEWWEAIPYEDKYNLWLLVGVLLFLAWLRLSYRVIRKALGHLYFRGTWYNAEQTEVLVKMLDEDCARGNRVMRADEMRVLRMWRFGREGGVLTPRKGSYF